LPPGACSREFRGLTDDEPVGDGRIKSLINAPAFAVGTGPTLVSG
jgi:hypothetical protein